LENKDTQVIASNPENKLTKLILNYKPKEFQKEISVNENIKEINQLIQNKPRNHSWFFKNI
jgi:hypothetical protein